MSSASEQPQETDTLLTSVLQDIDTLFPENELFQFFELPDKKEFEPTEEEEKV